MPSKTQKALALVAQGVSVRKAVREIDISETLIYRAIKALSAKENGRCACCGAPVNKDGKFAVAISR